MKFDHPTRVKAAIGIFVLLAVGSSLNHMYRDVLLLYTGADQVALSELRFEELRKLLPKHGRIGYLSETDPARFHELCIVQYVLAPLVISSSVDEELVVVYSRDGRSLKKPSDHHELVRDFGNGVALFAKRVEARGSRAHRQAQGL